MRDEMWMWEKCHGDITFCDTEYTCVVLRVQGSQGIRKYPNVLFSRINFIDLSNLRVLHVFIYGKLSMAECPKYFTRVFIVRSL